MAGSFAVDRLERSTLAAADSFARFTLAEALEDGSAHDPLAAQAERVASAVLRATEEAWARERRAWSETVADVARTQVQMLQEATGRTLEQIRLHAVRQHEAWSHAVGEGCARLGKQIGEAGRQLGEQLTRAAQSVADALETAGAHGQNQVRLLHDALAAHAERLSMYVAQMQASRTEAQEVLQGLSALGQALNETLARTEHLTQLEQALARNLEVLVQAGKLDQALNTLTAAVHLLAARSTAVGMQQSSPDREAA